MIRAWRLVKSRYASTAFDGEGARLHGGRWNSPGIVVAYASDSRALAVLEVLVHLQRSDILGSYSLASLHFAEELMGEMETSTLPAGWRRFPPSPEAQALGDRWVTEQRSAVLRVPSAIVPAEHNFLVNPAHREFAQVVVEPPEPFELDVRLLGT